MHISGTSKVEFGNQGVYLFTASLNVLLLDIQQLIYGHIKVV